MTGTVFGVPISRVLLVLTLITVVALAGCVQGENEEDDSGFDPEGSDPGTGAGGGGGDGGNQTDGDGGQGDGGPTAVEQEVQRGLDTLETEKEITELLIERRSEAGVREFSPSRSLKVAARDYSEDLSNRSDLQSLVQNRTVMKLEIDEDEIIERYEEANAVDCDTGRGAGWRYDQVNHVTLFNRSLRTSTRQIVQYDSPELVALGVVSDWMDNGSTRNTITDASYRNVGVGVEYDGATNIVFVTANFC